MGEAKHPLSCEPLAQLVEHRTFNPIIEAKSREPLLPQGFLFLYPQNRHRTSDCTTTIFPDMTDFQDARFVRCSFRECKLSCKHNPVSRGTLPRLACQDWSSPEPLRNPG